MNTNELFTRWKNEMIDWDDALQLADNPAEFIELCDTHFRAMVDTHKDALAVELLVCGPDAMPDYEVSERWKRIAQIYVYFAYSNDSMDFTPEAAKAFYGYESTGTPRVAYHEKQPNGLYNGFAVGKHWMDVQLSMWAEDLMRGDIAKCELLDDLDDLPAVRSFIAEWLNTVPCTPLFGHITI